MNKILLEEKDSSIMLKDNEKYLLEKELSDVNFTSLKDANTVLNIFNEDNVNINYVFNIEENSNLQINIFDASKYTQRNITINLNGENASASLNLSSISIGDNKYEVNAFHNNKNTISNTNLHGIALKDNKINFKNNGHIINGSEKSILNQDNKIIIMGENNSKIEPNLFIDEYDVKASHGAYIGKFNEDDIFYLKTRGLSEKESYNLLINGFLIGDFNIDEEYKVNLIKIINKYRR